MALKKTFEVSRCDPPLAPGVHGTRIAASDPGTDGNLAELLKLGHILHAQKLAH